MAEQLRAISVRAHQVSIKVAVKEVWEVLHCPEMTELDHSSGRNPRRYSQAPQNRSRGLRSRVSSLENLHFHLRLWSKRETKREEARAREGGRERPSEVIYAL